MLLEGLQPKEKKTYILDTSRLTVGGVMDTLLQSVLLVAAIKVFAIGDGMKGTISAAMYVGMILSLLYSAAFSGSGVRRSVLAFAPICGAGLMTAIAANANSGLSYTLLVCLAAMLIALRMPFLTAIYTENYHPSRRGRLLATGIVLAVVVSVATGWWFGRLLDRDVLLYRPILVFSGLSMAVSAGLLLFVPSDETRQRGDTNPIRNLMSVLRDRRFTLITVSWFLSGFAHLWSYPVRISYLAEPGRGLDLAPGAVLVITSVIPGIVRLLTMRPWGRLFDRYGFLSIRIVTNVLVGAGILVFFLTPILPVIAIGSVLSSCGLAGSVILVSLWVTKIAPKEKTQLYMSVHVFFTGVRGILGPYLGFFFVRRFTFLQMGLVSLALSVVSAIILFRLRRSGERI